MEQAFQMVHQNRSCHPGGEKMWLASEKQILWLEERTKKALDAEKEMSERVNELEFQRRSWHVITAGLCSACAVLFFLVGVLI